MQKRRKEGWRGVGEVEGEGRGAPEVPDGGCRLEGMTSEEEKRAHTGWKVLLQSDAGHCRESEGIQ